jgi:hypothetical protein
MHDLKRTAKKPKNNGETKFLNIFLSQRIFACFCMTNYAARNNTKKIR